MEKCTECGDNFIPGSCYQTKCRTCLDIEIESLTNKLQEVNKQIMGDWNKSVKYGIASPNGGLQQQSL